MTRRDGFVLVAALWLVVALSAAGLHAALTSQSQRRVAANQLDVTRSREAAIAGTEYVRARLTGALLERAEELRAQALRQTGAPRTRQSMLMAMTQEDPWRAPHELVVPQMALGEAEFVVDVHDTGVALNINQADETMLRSFLAEGLRIDYAWADRVTQAVMDWRDGDDLPRINGAERDDYIRAGAPVLPRNAPFHSIDELRHVMGVTPELFAAMRPYITIVGSGRINLNAAPEPVLVAVPTITPTVAAELLRRRGAGQFPRSRVEMQAMLGTLYRAPQGQELTEFNRRVTFATNEVEVVSEGRVTGSPVSTVVRVVLARSENAALLVFRLIE